MLELVAQSSLLQLALAIPGAVVSEESAAASVDDK
jgi:hypothetical protein